MAIGLGWGFNGLDGIRPALGDGCGKCDAGGDVILKFGWFCPIGCGLAGVWGLDVDGGVIGCWKRRPPSRGLCGVRKLLVLQKWSITNKTTQNKTKYNKSTSIQTKWKRKEIIVNMRTCKMAKSRRVILPLQSAMVDYHLPIAIVFDKLPIRRHILLKTSSDLGSEWIVRPHCYDRSDYRHRHVLKPSHRYVNESPYNTLSDRIIEVRSAIAAICRTIIQESMDAEIEAIY